MCIYIYNYTFRLILTFDELFNFYTVGNLTWFSTLSIDDSNICIMLNQ